MINRDKNGRFNTTNWWMKYFKRVSCAKKTGFKWRLKFLLLFHMCAMSYLLFTSKFLVDFATLLYVCVRACVRACVCMCACLGFFRLQDVRDMLEGTDQRSCVENINLPRFFISASENVIFYLQRRKLQPPQTGQKTIWHIDDQRKDAIYWHRI